MEKRRNLLFFLLLFFINGCVTIYNPATQRKEIYFIDEHTEIFLGRSFAYQILQREKIVKDKVILSLVSKIGRRLSKVCDRNNLQYYFYVLDRREMNAFALPGGYIFINRGLIERANEDEIAFCLAHEIGHICARHPIKRLQVSLGMEFLLNLTLRGAKYADIKRGLAVIYNIIALGYSREDEFLADSLGVKYAYKAGYDPYGAITLLRKLKKESGDDTTFVFLRSHPPVDERIRKVREQIHKLRIYHLNQ